MKLNWIEIQSLGLYFWLDSSSIKENSLFQSLANWVLVMSLLCLSFSPLRPRSLLGFSAISPSPSPTQPALLLTCISLQPVFLHIFTETFADTIGDLHDVKFHVKRCLGSTGCYWSLFSLWNTSFSCFFFYTIHFLFSSVTHPSYSSLYNKYLLSLYSTLYSKSCYIVVNKTDKTLQPHRAYILVWGVKW